MSLKRYAGDRFTKLAADPFPTNITIGAMCLNYNTGALFSYDGTNWIPCGVLISDGVTALTSTWSSQKISDELDNKVDKAVGKGLSDENYTLAEKNKLAGLESSKFVGQYGSKAALDIAHPTSSIGSYAYVDAGIGDPVQKYLWDSNDEEWAGPMETSEATPAQIKSLYEQNADTNAFTDQNQTDLAANTSARHTQGTDQSLDFGGANQTTAVEIRSHINDPDIHFTVDEIELGSNLAIVGGELQISITANQNELLFKNNLGVVIGSAKRSFNPATDIDFVHGYQRIKQSSEAEPTAAHDESVKFVETVVVGPDTVTYLYEKLGNGDKVIIASYVQ